MIPAGSYWGQRVTWEASEGLTSLCSTVRRRKAETDKVTLSLMKSDAQGALGQGRHKGWVVLFMPQKVSRGERGTWACLRVATQPGPSGIQAANVAQLKLVVGIIHR